ncbi:MAG: hypothetical protein GX102_01430 [Porphyromonadaceae bacterium]|nr:hypothetical protein [Porphyromonadaceae bacterium]
MDIERKIRMLTRSINVVYYTIYLLTIFAVVVIFVLSFGDVSVKTIDPLSKLGTNISTAYIIYLLVSIPAGLFLFHQYTLKLRKETDEYIKFQKYKKAAYLRLWVVGIGLIIGVILVYVLRSQSMIFTAAIAAIALYFCKPSGVKVIRELDLDADPNQMRRRF